jgi:hypothetical protein
MVRRVLPRSFGPAILNSWASHSGLGYPLGNPRHCQAIVRANPIRPATRVSVRSGTHGNARAARPDQPSDRGNDRHAEAVARRARLRSLPEIRGGMQRGPLEDTLWGAELGRTVYSQGPGPRPEARRGREARQRRESAAGSGRERVILAPTRGVRLAI